MKRYVRTKDKIWTNKNPDGTKTVFTSRYNPKEVIKEADTIPELCDEFVVDSFPVNHERQALNYPIEIWKEIWNGFIHDTGMKFFGVIYVDGEEVRVAELDEKGNWKLL